MKLPRVQEGAGKERIWTVQENLEGQGSHLEMLRGIFARHNSFVCLFASRQDRKSYLTVDDIDHGADPKLALDCSGLGHMA